MDLGYQGKLFLLAFDHRGSLTEGMFGIGGGAPAPEERARVVDAKRLIWDGFRAARPPAEAGGVLVDEEFGAGIAREAREAGVLLAMPVERSGQEVFDFEYREDFGAHIEAFDPHFAKALVRWNPADPPEVKQLQAARLRRLGDWLHQRARRFLLELIVPATERQLALAGDSTAAYDTRLRPGLMLEAMAEIQESGIEPDVWKIEGVDAREDCELLARLARRRGRDEVKAVVLGRGAPAARVERWVRAAAGVGGYAGFAIGRTLWWDAVKGWKDGALSRDQAAGAVAAAYRRFVEVYESAAG